MTPAICCAIHTSVGIALARGPMWINHIDMTQKRTTAGMLLANILNDGSWTPERLARELMVSPRTMNGFIAGSLAIPLERQLLLARIALHYAPRHARLARRLEAQVTAAIHYYARDTVTHRLGPVGRSCY